MTIKQLEYFMAVARSLSFTEAAAGAIRRFEPLRLYLSAAFSAEPLDEEY